LSKVEESGVLVFHETERKGEEAKAWSTHKQLRASVRADLALFLVHVRQRVIG
jgi:predicted component of type VI protein secretion system